MRFYRLLLSAREEISFRRKLASRCPNFNFQHHRKGFGDKENGEDLCLDEYFTMIPGTLFYRRRSFHGDIIEFVKSYGRSSSP